MLKATDPLLPAVTATESVPLSASRMKLLSEPPSGSEQASLAGLYGSSSSLPLSVFDHTQVLVLVTPLIVRVAPYVTVAQQTIATGSTHA
jgi:hypothetical protein